MVSRIIHKLKSMPQGLAFIIFFSVTIGLILIAAPLDSENWANESTGKVMLRAETTSKKSEDNVVIDPKKANSSNDHDLRRINMLLKLNQAGGREITYGADKVSEVDSSGRIILLGRVWVRIGNAILDGRSDADSKIILNEASNKIVSKHGVIEIVTLLSEELELSK